MILGLASRCPRTAHFRGRVSKRTEHGKPLERGRKRQRLSVVLQQDDGTCTHGTRQLSSVGASRGSFRLRPSAIGIVEESESLLELQNAADGRVDLLHRDESALECDRESAPIRLGHHVDVDACIERQCCRLRQVDGNTVADEFADGVVVADEDACETQLAAQVVAQQRDVRCHRNAGKIRERRHYRGNSRRDRCFEWRQMDLAQSPLGDVHGCVVPTGVDGSVCAEMLCASSDRFH